MVLQASDLQKACAIGRDDPGSDMAPTQADFQERVHSLAAQLMQVRASVQYKRPLACMTLQTYQPLR